MPSLCVQPQAPRQAAARLQPNQVFTNAPGGAGCVPERLRPSTAHTPRLICVCNASGPAHACLNTLCCKCWGGSGLAVHCAACRAGMLAHKSVTTYLRLCRAGRRAARAHCLQPRPAACASSKGQPRPSVCHTERQTLARLRVGTELSWELGVAVHIQGFEHPLWQLDISQAREQLGRGRSSEAPGYAETCTEGHHPPTLCDRHGGRKGPSAGRFCLPWTSCGE